MTGAALDDPPGVALDDPPGVTLDDSGATLELDAPGVTLELDPPGVTLGATVVTLGTDADRAGVADRALGPGEREIVLRCFRGGSTRTMELGSPVMTAPLWSSGGTITTFFGMGLRLLSLIHI